jgi:hypothetical protein
MEETAFSLTIASFRPVIRNGIPFAINMESPGRNAIAYKDKTLND